MVLGKPIPVSSIITGNIRALKPGLRDSKIEYLANLANVNNSDIITLTESHLSEDISDAEVHIDGWASVRCDRHKRYGGGIITYIKEGYTISNVSSYSDSMTETLCLYINELNIGLVTVYRPPGCDTGSFRNSLNSIDKWIISMIKFKNLKIVMTGDFNFGFLKTWDTNTIVEFTDKVNKGSDNDRNLSAANLQASLLLDFTSKWNLTQIVKDSTRLNNTLDLIFTDCLELFGNISIDKHVNLSDHDTIIAELHVETKETIDEERKNFCFTKIPEYKTENMSPKQIAKAKEYLKDINWEGVTADSLTKVIEDMVVKFCSPRKKDLSNFKSKNRIPRIVRLHMRRKQEASKALKIVKKC